MYRTSKSPSGYASVDAYREALKKFPRDLLRKMNAPLEVSGDGRIAAILKARTGNRVWSAKKDDIIDAMIEFAQRQGKFLEPVGEQLDIEMQKSLPFNSLRQSVDADGNAMVDFAPSDFPGGRGMDAALREDFKRRILQAAIDNGEVQPDVTPIPAKVPQTDFNQGNLIDSLFADESGQLPMMFATDTLPAYKAGGRSAESLLEEVRLRYDWAELDNASKQASKESLMKKEGWDKMTWEEKKQAGIMDPFLYSLPSRERTYTGVTQTLAADSIGVVDPDAAVLPPREAKTYRWKPEGVIEEPPAQGVNQKVWAPLRPGFAEIKPGSALFHGTGKGNVASIRASGFRNSRKGNAGTPGDLGDGVYFSPSKAGASAYGDAVVINKATGESSFESNFIEGFVPSDAHILSYKGTPDELAQKLKTKPAKLRQKLKAQGYDGYSAKAAGSTTDEPEIVIWSQPILDQISGTKKTEVPAKAPAKTKLTPDEKKVVRQAKDKAKREKTAADKTAASASRLKKDLEQDLAQLRKKQELNCNG
jgi:hypothetical protein